MRFQPAHLYARVVDHLPPLPWHPADPNVRGDPRKSVKWIDVGCLILFLFLFYFCVGCGL